METITFDRLLLKTAFCCMASDGNIDKREIALIKSMCENSPIFVNFDYKKEINELVKKLNTRGKEFISYYFDMLNKSTLSEEDELTLIDFAVNTIKADELIEYAEIKFFKVIRHNLKVSDEKILEVYPEIESWLEEDIVTDSYLSQITKQYLDIAELPQFELISSIELDSAVNETKNI
jgi:uncharacterized tellurite resistance protein B-like protein